MPFGTHVILGAKTGYPRVVTQALARTLAVSSISAPGEFPTPRSGPDRSRPSRSWIARSVVPVARTPCRAAADGGVGHDRVDDELEAVPGQDVVSLAGLPQLPLRPVLVQPPLVSLGQGCPGLRDMDEVDDGHGRE